MQENDTPIHPTDAGMTRIADVLTGALTQGVVGGASSLTVTGGGGGSSSWNTLADKPSEFAPADHSASKITTGTIAPARLGTGTANSTTVLHGDGVYRPVSGSGGSTITETATDGLYQIGGGA